MADEKEVPQRSDETQQDEQEFPGLTEKAEKKVKEGHGPAFPVIGIGASAGGLAALKVFLTNTPPKTGMAFVIVLHLAPNRKSIIDELLQLRTEMPVTQVEDETIVKPDHVYVIPPNHTLYISDGHLHLGPRKKQAPGKPHLPIDIFFRTLAEVQNERAIGIILSGTGSDGSLGARAIGEAGGMVMVQEPAEAQYDGMPRSAIATGYVTYVLPVAEMPQQLLDYVIHLGSIDIKQINQSEETESFYQTIFKILRDQTGNDFSKYKRTTFGRRVQRRMVINEIDELKDYVRYLKVHPSETQDLFQDLLIGVTNFFRDPQAFRALEEDALPRIFDGHDAGEAIRVWVAGCSTGEEAYSIAILLHEAMERSEQHYNVQIFASDVDAHAIRQARLGRFSQNIAADVSPERMKRYFVREESGYRIQQEIREMVIFAEHNVIKDPPFSHMDLISCRNLLIYMGSELQKQVLPIFRYGLKPGGILFLGTAESLGPYVDLFEPISKKWNIFRNVKSSDSYLDVWSEIPFSLSTSQKKQEAQPQVSNVAQAFLLDHYAPPSVVIDRHANVLYVYGRTGMYLEPAPGEASLNLLQMARDGLRMPLTLAVQRVMHEESEQTVYRNVQVKSNGDYVSITLRVLRINASPIKELILVSFEEEDEAITEGEEPTSESERELRNHVRDLEEELRSTREHLQSANEELLSANEELQSSNEELQSTNEELETSREELQSVNEELVTINAELQEKIDELSRANNDLDNMFSSTQLATIFLDPDLQVRRFTPATLDIFPLMDSDVGRPLTHLTSNLVSENVVVNANRVLDTLAPIEQEVQTQGGSWYWMRVLPYRTRGNVIDGVVITFNEITEQKEIQKQLRTLIVRAIEQSNTFLLIANREGTIEYTNPYVTKATGYTEAELMGQSIDFLISGEEEEGGFSRIGRQLLTGEVWRGQLKNRRKDGTLYWQETTITPVFGCDDRITHFIVVAENITDRKEIEARLHL